MDIGTCIIRLYMFLVYILDRYGYHITFRIHLFTITHMFWVSLPADGDLFLGQCWQSSDYRCSQSTTQLIAPCKANRSSRLSLRLLVQRNIRRQLRLLLCQLRIQTRLPLSRLNLQSQDIGLELQNLILYLPELQGRAGRRASSARGGDRIVEPTCSNLSLLGNLRC